MGAQKYRRFTGLLFLISTFGNVYNTVSKDTFACDFTFDASMKVVPQFYQMLQMYLNRSSLQTGV